MPRETQKLLFDVEKAIMESQSFVREVSLEEFLESRLLQTAVERTLGIIGEALNRLSRVDEDAFNQIDQAHRIIGMRNILAHGYDVIDYRIIWSTVQENLNPLLAQVRDLM